MPTPCAPPIIVAHNARTERQPVVRASSTPPALGLRARIVLRAADTDTPTNLQIGQQFPLFSLLPLSPSQQNSLTVVDGFIKVKSG